MHRRVVVWLVSVVGFTGCTAVIGSAPGGDDPTTGGKPTALCAAAPAPTTRVRRLTKVEIQSSTGVLFNSAASMALSDLDSDSQINGSFSNSDLLRVSGSLANGLNLAAETIGTQFKTTVTKTTFDPTCFSTDAAAETCATTFMRTFGKKAFRRPITDDDVTALTPVYEAGRQVGVDGDAGDRFATGLSWVVRAMVQSPDFLYLTELGDPAAANGAKSQLTSAETASALSYSVLGMPPDDMLVAAADGNQLATPEQRAAQVQRLISGYPDAWKLQMRQFIPQWLGINYGNPEWAKTKDAAPLYSPSLVTALSTETDMFINDWATSPDGARLDTLLTSSSTFLNQTNAPVYGATVSGSGFVKTALDPSQRAGILTMAGFLGSTSHAGETSPVQRGKVIMQRFLCQDPPPPPPVVPPLPAVTQAAPTTTRARYDTHLSNSACSGCHSLFQPMGDAFEEYDVLGGFRTQQNGFPIDSSGALVGATGGDKPVANAIELVKVLAQSPDTFECVARQAFRFTIGHLETGFDECNIQTAKQVLSGGQPDVRALVSSIVGSDSFVVRTVANQ